MLSHMVWRARRLAVLVGLTLGSTAALVAQAGQGGQPAPQNLEWRTHGGSLASTRYSALDQIHERNFSRLEVAWRFKTDNLGPRPDYDFQATPLMINGTLYFTGGTRRTVVALDAATGEYKWVYHLEEGKRAEASTRRKAGRGVAYWTDGKEERIVYVTHGYQMIALDARTGRPVPGFGRNGIVDLKTETDQPTHPITGELGLNGSVLIAGDVIIVGASGGPGLQPKTMTVDKAFVRGYDVRTGRRLWIFHTIPSPGEYGNETWLNESWSYTGNTGAWALLSA